MNDFFIDLLAASIRLNFFKYRGNTKQWDFSLSPKHMLAN